MKLGTLNTSNAVEEGRFCHLKHPAFKHPLYAGEGADDLGRLVDKDKPHDAIGAIVRGWYSDTVQAVLEQNAKEDLKDNAVKAKDAGDRLALALIVEFVNIEGDDGKPLKADAAGVSAFRAQSRDLDRQIILFARDEQRSFTGDLPT